MNALDRYLPGVHDAIQRGRRHLRPAPGANPLNALTMLMGGEDGPMSVIDGPASAATKGVVRAAAPVARRAAAEAAKLMPSAATAAPRRAAPRRAASGSRGITGAAIELSDGRHIVASSHPQAFEYAMRQGYTEADVVAWDLFRTAKGKFIPKDDALHLVRPKSGGRAREVHSSNFNLTTEPHFAEGAPAQSAGLRNWLKQINEARTQAKIDELWDAVGSVPGREGRMLEATLWDRERAIAAAISRTP
jgi:hypothetical protein